MHFSKKEEKKDEGYSTSQVFILRSKPVQSSAGNSGCCCWVAEKNSLKEISLALPTSMLGEEDNERIMRDTTTELKKREVE